MKKYHLIDIDHNRDAIRQDSIYEVASQIALKYGCRGNRGENYTYDRIREFWKYEDPCPSLREFRDAVKVSTIKWYIRNKTVVDYPIWNADFLHGVAAHCKIIWNKKHFPSCDWYSNEDITNLFQSCPYGGEIVKSNNIARHRWVRVPSLYLKYSEDSISFMAGVMAGLKKINIDDENYALVNERILPLLKKWGIPIDITKFPRLYLISPIWPALFARYMPENVSQKWLNLKKAHKVDVYAPILWKTYVNGIFPVDGIPYLKSKRTIYYDFKCEEGAMDKLDKLRVEKNLTVLDNRIKEVVQIWAKEIK